MIHPHTELKLINNVIGYGIVATKLIPCGTITWTLCDFDQSLIFAAEEVNAMDEDYKAIVEHYGYINDTGKYVLCWDFARYMNHSCFYNTLPIDNFNEIAIRDIKPGEQITCDYSFLYYPTTMSCFCGEDNCRKEIKRRSHLYFQADEKKLVEAALTYFDKVEQPLYKFMKNKELSSTLIP